MPKLIDRSRMVEQMKGRLKLDPAQTSVVTIDCQRGNLDPAMASLPVPEAECDRMIRGTNGLLGLARIAGIAIIHVTRRPTNRLFWRAIRSSVRCWKYRSRLRRTAEGWATPPAVLRSKAVPDS